MPRSQGRSSQAREHPLQKPGKMLLPASATLGLLLAGCGGRVSNSPLTVEISDARLVDTGTFTVDAVIDARVTAGREGGVFRLWAGALWPHRPARPLFFGGHGTWEGRCDEYLGWELEIDEGDAELALAPHEEVHVRLRAKSGRSPTCAPDAALAWCGERVTVVVVPEGDGRKGGAFETTFGCDLRAVQPPSEPMVSP
jgi:hypothetical protein